MAGAKTTEDVLSTDLNTLRADILGSAPDHREVKWKGHKLHLREPPAGEVLNFKAGMEEGADMGTQTMSMLVRYLYTPEGQKVFTEADVEVLLTIPFSQEFQKILEGINELMGVAVKPDDKSKAPAQSAPLGGDDNSVGAGAAGDGSLVMDDSAD